MSDAVIAVENLSKAYVLGHAERKDTLLGSIAHSITAPLRNLRELRRLNTFRLRNHEEDSDDILWALKEVSFEVKRGEVLGIIGQNGAGKSTLLKILARIAEPTRGRAIIRGRVSALLEVGTGFHPDLTGRENIFLNGTILGMRKAEIDSKFDEIVDFSGVERFIDTPVKRYSSGMLVRLAFAVAAHLEPEILIVDEVLAVGDAEFQKKCLGKMREVSTGEGRTVLFVSHNMPAVATLCNRVVRLASGVLVDDGNPNRIIADYLQKDRQTGGLADLKECNSERSGQGPMRIVQVSTRDAAGAVCSRIGWNETLALEVVVESEQQRGVVLAIGIRDELGKMVLNYNNLDDAEELVVENGTTRIRITPHANWLNEGDYGISLGLYDAFKGLHDSVWNCLEFSVHSASATPVAGKGAFRVPCKWSVG